MLQAEDGIRDVAVTGVQTCALPIHHIVSHAVNITIHCFQWPIIVGHDSIEASFSRLKHCMVVSASLQRRRSPDEEIGRASCRERV
mgnify:CR=1 FL=1